MALVALAMVASVAGIGAWVAVPTARSVTLTGTADETHPAVTATDSSRDLRSARIAMSVALVLVASALLGAGAASFRPSAGGWPVSVVARRRPPGRAPPLSFA